MVLLSPRKKKCFSVQKLLLIKSKGVYVHLKGSTELVSVVHVLVTLEKCKIHELWIFALGFHRIIKTRQHMSGKSLHEGLEMTGSHAVKL